MKVKISKIFDNLFFQCNFQQTGNDDLKGIFNLIEELSVKIKNLTLIN